MAAAADEPRAEAADARLRSPAAWRNRGPILAAIRPHLPAAGCLLEVASGSGEHAVFIARALPGLVIQPSDPRAEARASIAAWAAAEGLANVLPPLDLDVTRPAAEWPLDRADAVLAINLLHVAPPEAGPCLFAGAARLLAPGAPLFCYGPFLEPGRAPAPSNLAFDAQLRARNPAWGLRRTDRLAAAAAAEGLRLVAQVPMPANNLTLVFRRAAP